MPKRGKEPRPSSRHSGGRFSPPPPPPRQSRNDYQVAGPSRSTSDTNSGRRSPRSNDNNKISNGNTRHGNNSNRIYMNVVNSPIILTDDDDDDDYKNLDNQMNIFRENGNNLKPDTDEDTRLVKHFVPSADRYHMSQSAPEKPMFRGPETDVLHDLEKDKLKNIRVQMIRADVQNDSFRKAYVIEEPVARSTKGDKNHQNFDDRQTHFNPPQMHYDNGEKNYGMSHSMSPRMMSRDRSLSPRMNIGRPPSPPLPYSPERDHFNSDNMLRRDRSKRSSERNTHERPSRPEHFLDQMKMDNFSSGPPEPRSPDMQRFRPGDHNRHRVKDEPMHYENRSRRSGSPVYFDNHYPYRSPSPNIRPFSPRGQLAMSPPSSRELSTPPLRDRQSHPNDRSRRRRTPPPRRDRSRDRRRRISPRRRTPPPPIRSPIKRRENGSKKRGPNKNQEARKREAKDKKNSRSQSKPNSSTPQQEQQQQLTSFQEPQPQPMYRPPLPPPGVVRLPPPPRPFPPGPMMIPMRPPPFPPPMGGWRPARPPMQAPPSGWPYPRPRPFYFPY